MYLGHDGHMDNHGHKAMVARTWEHQGWENLCVRKCPERGYLLLSEHWDKLLRIDVVESFQWGGDEAKLVARDWGGMAWECIRIAM